MRIGTALREGVTAVTKTYTKIQRQRLRSESAGRRAMARFYKNERNPNTKEHAFAVMEEAYQHASGNGQHWANARQIMYVARKLILARGQELNERFDKYFTSTLLPEYQREHPESEDWRVAYDPRGTLHEPHTKRQVLLGTIAVQQYLAKAEQDRKSVV